MADIAIESLRNVRSRTIRDAENAYNARSYSIFDPDSTDKTFQDLLTKAVDNINTTNGYLSDAENEEIKWALGKTNNTHDLSIALQKAETALQYTVAVRDRVMQAYNQIMQMQI